MVDFRINGETIEVDADPSTPLLWIIREHLKLTGTKFGCGIAQCGACTVHLNGAAIFSCVTPLAAAEGQDITTIEGLSAGSDHPLQKAWVEEEVPQCGYCQSGQIMKAATLLDNNNNPSEEQITAHMNTNLCRCGTYLRIRKAIHRAAELAQESEGK